MLHFYHETLSARNVAFVYFQNPAERFILYDNIQVTSLHSSVNSAKR